jgi:hypothetical protein
MKNIINILFLNLIFGLSFVMPMQVQATFQNTPDLEVNWGVKDGSPIFDIKDTKPCDEIKRDVVITNKSSFNRKLKVQTKFDGNPGLLARGLYMTISQGNNILYGGNNSKTLLNLQADSESKNGMVLITLTPKQKLTLRFTVKFPCSAGNEYQGKKTKFDLILSLDEQSPHFCPPLPSHCRFLFDYRHVSACSYLYNRICRTYGSLDDFQKCRFP